MRISICNLFVDTGLLCVCAAGLRLMPARTHPVPFLYFAFFLFVVIVCRLHKQRRQVVRFGAIVGGVLIGPGMIIPPVLQSVDPNYSVLFIALPIGIAVGMAMTCFLFVSTHWLQHLIK